MSENEDTNVKKSKLLYALHIIVPICLVAISNAIMILTSLQMSNGTESTSIIYNDTTEVYNATKEVKTTDKILEILNLDNKSAQDKILFASSVLMVVFSFLSVVYSKMMNSEQHNLGEKVMKVLTEKNVILEQFTNLTNSLSRPISIRNEEYQASVRMEMEDYEPLSQNTTVANSPNARMDTCRSDSTVYMKPYCYNESNEPTN